MMLALLSILMVQVNCASAETPWEKINSWGYQLTGYDDGGFHRLASASCDLLVIDLASDGGSDYFTSAQIKTLKDTNKVVLAYFEIGAIEQYRPEWATVPAELMAGEVDGWPKEQYVKYWEAGWWPVVRARIERALAAGFDGAYLDLITAYDEIPNTELSTEERAKRMVSLLVRISDFAKTKNRDFKIVAQNCPELANWAFWEPRVNQEYLNAIDGVAIESPFYRAHDELCKAQWCEENRENAKFIKSQGKLLLGVDYAKKPESMRDSYKRQRAAGYVPFVSVRALDRVLIPNENSARPLRTK